jgi:hypothetical protein
MYRVTDVSSTAFFKLRSEVAMQSALSGGITWLVSMEDFGIQNGQSMVLHI